MLEAKIPILELRKANVLIKDSNQIFKKYKVNKMNTFEAKTKNGKLTVSLYDDILRILAKKLEGE